MSVTLGDARRARAPKLAAIQADDRQTAVGAGRDGLTWRRAVLALLALLVACQAAVLAYHLAATVAFPYDLDYGEGYVLNDALRLARGESLYVDLQQFPMVRSPYPPLYPLLWSALLPLSGPAFWIGRALSVTALVAVAALVGLNAWRACRGRWPVLAAVGLVLGSPFVYDWAGYARVDMLALALAVGGVVTAQWVGGWRGVLLAAMLGTLAVWTKQTTITAVVAIGVAFALRDWRRAAAFVGLVGVPSAGVLLALNAATGGEFVRHVLTGNGANPVSPVRAVIYVMTFAGIHLPALAAAVWWLRRTLTRAASPVAIYVPVALFAAFSVGNGGSSVNYLLEPVLALALALPFAWRAAQAVTPIAGPLLAVLQLALLLHWPNGFGTSYLGAYALGRTPTAADWQVGAHIDDVVQHEPGAVLAEPAGFAVRNGRPVYVQPIDLRAEQALGRWRSQPLIDALAASDFRLLITAYNLFPHDVEPVIDDRFTLAETLPAADGLTYRIYRFRGSRP